MTAGGQLVSKIDFLTANGQPGMSIGVKIYEKKRNFKKRFPREARINLKLFGTNSEIF